MYQIQWISDITKPSDIQSPFLIQLHQKYSRIYLFLKMGPDIKIESKSEKVTSLYRINKAKYGGENYYAKIFDQSALQRQGLLETIRFNYEVLHKEYKKLKFQNYILPILSLFQTSSGPVFMIPFYSDRLDQHVKKKFAIEEKQVRAIAQDLLKGICGVLVAGFSHRNIRLQHFVFSEGHWKLESIVMNQEIDPKAYHCEYAWSIQHLTPEGYDKEKYSEAQLDNKIVWDFGCMLIHMILGFHKLKNSHEMKCFEGQGFSFKKIKAKIGQKFSTQFKQILGKMCHHDPEKRMKLGELMQSGFFSKEVAETWKKQRSLSIEEIEQKIYSCNNSVIRQLINYLEKAKILTQSCQELKGIIEFTQNPQSTFEIIVLTKYAISFIKCIELSRLAKSLNQRTLFENFAIVSEASCKTFYQSLEYTYAKELITFRQKQTKKVLDSMKPLNLNDTTLKNLIIAADPQNTVFGDIKRFYRNILKISYNLVCSLYKNNKAHKLATIGFYLVYCLAIDKMYIAEDLHDNFGPYFDRNGNLQAGVTYEGLQQFIKGTDRRVLVEHSVYVLDKYFDI